jgi:hypothetical protein
VGPLGQELGMLNIVPFTAENVWLLLNIPTYILLARWRVCHAGYAMYM